MKDSTDNGKSIAERFSAASEAREGGDLAEPIVDRSATKLEAKSAGEAASQDRDGVYGTRASLEAFAHPRRVKSAAGSSPRETAARSSTVFSRSFRSIISHELCM
jgi:hypothetical protein